jgi:hypothetical protein
MLKRYGQNSVYGAYFRTRGAREYIKINGLITSCSQCIITAWMHLLWHIIPRTELELAPRTLIGPLPTECVENSYNVLHATGVPYCSAGLLRQKGRMLTHQCQHGTQPLKYLVRHDITRISMGYYAVVSISIYSAPFIPVSLHAPGPCTTGRA